MTVRTRMDARRGYKKPKRSTKGVVRSNSKPNEVSLEQEEFIATYVAKKGHLGEAAKAMDISRDVASKWLKLPGIKKALAEEKVRLRAITGYNLQAAMRDALRAEKFAIDTGNANALAKVIEHKAKLHGLLIEKHDHRMAANFQINIDGAGGPAIGPGETVPRLPNSNPGLLRPVSSESIIPVTSDIADVIEKTAESVVTPQLTEDEESLL